MSLFVLAAVLAAALMHASWNAVVKAGGGSRDDAVLIAIGAGALAGPALFFVPLPAPASWPALAASTVIHVVYFRLVAAAYREGALSVAYPLMRGAPPLVVAALSGVVLGESLPATGWLAVSALAAGVLLLSGESFRARALTRKGTMAVAANVVVIVLYILVDGAGVRAAGNAWSYVAWLFALNALALVFMLRAESLAALRARPGRLAFGGACTLGSYGIALWAMTQAPVALVAAARETSVLFGAALAALVLHERFGPLRWIAVALTLGGIVAMRAA
jgi:drug/metabolite transporter (DMT)-like permease